MKFIPKHFHNLLLFDVADGDDLLVDGVVVNDDDINILFPAGTCTVTAVAVLRLLSSHFLFLIKSRFTLTLSHKCGHSIVRRFC